MKTFLVIDDSQDFIEALKVLWEEIEKSQHPIWDGKFLHHNQLDIQQDFSSITQNIAGKDHILLDSSLISDKLLNLINRMVPNTKLWMFTGWQQEEYIKNWENWRKYYGATLQAQWFEKPLNLEQVLATLDAVPLITDISPTPFLSWTQWPLPCRLFDPSLIPIANNSYWRIAVDAFPTISKHDQAKLDDGKPIIQDTWCEQPDSPRRYGLACFYAIRFKEGHYLQLGLSYPNRQNFEIEDAVGQIFSLMLDGDQFFSRARYYEVVAVPGSAGVLWLKNASHQIKGVLPVNRPIGKTLEDRLNRYKRDFRKDQLIYKIFTSKEDKKEDPDVVFWNDVVCAGKSPWLDLPIYINHRVAALLIFDRSERKTGVDDIPNDQITEEMIDRLEPKLMGAINYLRQAFQHQDESKELNHYRNYANWQETLVEKMRQDERNPHAIRTTHLEHEIIKKAKQDTDAATIMLATLPPTANYMEVRAFNNERVAGGHELRLPLNRPHFIAVQCACKAKPVYITNYYKDIPVDERISKEDWQAALAHLGLEEMEQNRRVVECQSWLRDIKSIAALPMKYDEQVLGVLILCHPNPYYFTQERVTAAQTLIRYAQPYLHQVRTHSARDAWDSMIMHTLRTSLSDIRAQADYILVPSPDVNSETAAKRILSRTENITELSNQVMYLLGYGDRKLSTPYNHAMPLNILRNLWESLSELSEAKGKSLEIDLSAANAQLKDPWNAFYHVLYVLLDNAIKYGQAGPIQINTSIDSDHWKLILINRGQFSDSVIRRDFRSFDLSSREDLGQKSLRVHIGLAVTYRLLEEVKGSLELSNEKRDGHEYARMELRWPLQSNQLYGDKHE